MTSRVRKIWAAPFAIAVLSITGLMSALLGDALIWKALAWFFLAIPLLTALWFSSIKSWISRAGN